MEGRDGLEGWGLQGGLEGLRAGGIWSWRVAGLEWERGCWRGQGWRVGEGGLEGWRCDIAMRCRFLRGCFLR